MTEEKGSGITASEWRYAYERERVAREKAEAEASEEAERADLWKDRFDRLVHDLAEAQQSLSEESARIAELETSLTKHCDLVDKLTVERNYARALALDEAASWVVTEGARHLSGTTQQWCAVADGIRALATS